MNIKFHSGSALRKPSLFRIVPGFILCLLLFVSIKHLVSDVYLEQAKKIFRSDEGIEKPPPVFNALALLDKSLMWNSRNANALGYQALLLYEQWRLEPKRPAAKNSAGLNKAIQSLNLAITQKPNWPFYHIQKAQIYAQYDHLEKPFYKSFSRAYELGKYETNTALRLLRIGIANWFQLSDEYRGIVIDLMHLSLQQKSNSPRDLWQLIDSNNLGTWFCFKLPESSRRDQLCSYK